MNVDSIAGLTARFMASRPALKECARLGVLNHSAVARLVAKYLKIPNSGAIVAAVTRYASRLKKVSSHEEMIREIILKSALNIRTKMMVGIIRKAASRGKIARVVEELQKSGEDFCWIEGLETCTLITSQMHARLVKSVLASSLEELILELALIQLKLSRKAMTTPGFSSFLLAQVAEQGVNVIEALTSSGEMLLLVDNQDLQKSVMALEECGTSRRGRAAR